MLASRAHRQHRRIGRAACRRLRCPGAQRLRVFRSCPFITPKGARSSLQMLAIAGLWLCFAPRSDTFSRAARSRSKSSQPLSPTALAAGGAPQRPAPASRRAAPGAEPAGRPASASITGRCSACSRLTWRLPPAALAQAQGVEVGQRQGRPGWGAGAGGPFDHGPAASALSRGRRRPGWPAPPG